MSARVAIPGGYIYYRPDRVKEPNLSLFQLDHWNQQGKVEATAAGRGAAWFIEAGGDRHWVLRRYRRGGLVRRFIRDKYFYTGEQRTRPCREWRVLEYLEHHGLPAPRPVAARYVKCGLLYHADMITERLRNVRPLSAILSEQALPAAAWRSIGACIRRFHDAGVNHADLNAHNILLNDSEQVWLIDFDKARISKPGRWQQANLARLARSLNKLRTGNSTFHYPGTDWHALYAGYENKDNPRRTQITQR